MFVYIVYIYVIVVELLQFKLRYKQYTLYAYSIGLVSLYNIQYKDKLERYDDGNVERILYLLYDYRCMNTYVWIKTLARAISLQLLARLPFIHIIIIIQQT